MRKAIVYLVFVSLFLISTPVVFALEGDTKYNPTVSISPTQKRLERQQMLLELKESMLEKRVDRKASISAKLTEKRRQIIENHWQRLLRRLQAAVDRLDKLIQRIEGRLAKIKGNNPNEDTSVIETQLNEAKSKLAEAKTKLSALQDIADPAFNSESPKDAFSVVRTNVSEVKVLLKKVHNILVHIIGDVKGLGVGQKDLNEVTPTVTASPTNTLTPTITLTPTPSPIVTPTI